MNEPEKVEVHRVGIPPEPDATPQGVPAEGEQRPPDPKASPVSMSERDLVRLHAKLGLDDEDIAACLDLSPTAVRRKYRKRLRKWRAQRRATLRKYQLEQASKSPSVINMLIHDEFGKATEAKKAELEDAEPWFDEKVG